MDRTQAPQDARKSFRDIAPKLAEVSDEVLFGDIGWPSAMSAVTKVRELLKEAKA